MFYYLQNQTVYKIMNHCNSGRSMEGEQIEQIQDDMNESLDNQNAQDYSLQFENRFKIYQLNSQVNQANLRLQKMALQYQNSMKEERQYFSHLQQQKNMLAQKYEELEDEYHQVNIMLETEKKDKVESSQNFKEMQDLIKKIQETLGLSEEDPREHILVEIQNILERWNQSNLIIEKLTDVTMLMNHDFKEKDQEKEKEKEKELKQNPSEVSIEKSVAAIEQNQKYKELEKQLLQTQQLLNQKQAAIQEMSEKLSNLYKKEIEIDELIKNLQCLEWQNTTKDEELRSLRIKQENWTITRDKSREQKIKYDEQIEQLKFQLELSGRKIQIFEGKIKEESLRCKKLQQIIGQYKRKQIQSEQKQMELHQQYGDLKKKLHISQIYKDKFKQTQTKLKEVEERIAQFNNMTEQYANQIHQLEDQLSTQEDKNKELEQSKKSLIFQLQLKEKEIIKIKMTVDHHQQLIKSNQTDIERYQKKIEHYQKNSENSFRNNRIEQEQNLRLQTQIVNQDIIKHYQSLLESEDRNRSQLQKQYQQAYATINQLKNQMNQLQRDYNQVKQERQLLKDQNIRLMKNNTQIQRLQQKKIDQIRERYRQIKLVNRETNDGPRRRMRIVSCFSFFQQAEGIQSSSYTRKIFSQSYGQPERQFNLRRTESSKFFKEQSNFQTIDEANSPSETSPISSKTFKSQKVSEKLIRPPRLDDEEIRCKENNRSIRFKNI